MEDLIVGAGLIGRALTRGVLLHSLIRDPRHVEGGSPGCLLCSNVPSAALAVIPAISYLSWLCLEEISRWQGQPGGEMMF